MYRWFPVLLLFCCFHAFGQKPSYLNLDKLKWPEISGLYYVEQVIDARTPGTFQETTAAELQSLFSRSFSKEGSIPLIIRINYLAIYEVVPGEHPIAFCSLNLSFIARKDSSYAEIFQSAVTTKQVGSKLNVHAQNIRNALEQSFSGFFQRLAENKLTPKRISKSELLKNPLPDQDYRVLKAGFIPKGIFKTFYDFRDLTPDNGIEFDMAHEEWSQNALPRATLRVEHDNLESKDVWGFSDGRYAYVRIGNRYYPLNKVDNGYTVQCDRRQFSPKDPSAAVAAGVVVGGVVGGLLGALVYYTATAFQEEIIQCEIDFTNGTPSPIEEEQGFTAGEVYFYHTTYSKGDNLTLSINGTEHCNIPRGNYYPYACTMDNLQLEACLTDDAGKTHCQILPASLTSQIYLCKIKDGIPQFEALAGEVESSMLISIDKGSIAGSCKE